MVVDHLIGAGGCIVRDVSGTPRRNNRVRDWHWSCVRASWNGTVETKKKEGEGENWRPTLLCLFLPFLRLAPLRRDKILKDHHDRTAANSAEQMVVFRRGFRLDKRVTYQRISTVTRVVGPALKARAACGDRRNVPCACRTERVISGSHRTSRLCVCC